MDSETAHILCDLNTRFYAENAASFSETRAGGWPGWGRLVEELYGYGCAWADTQRAGTCAAERAETVCVVDAACGNLRFERFLAETLPDVEFAVDAFDNCEALVGEAPAWVSYHACDIAGALLAGEPALPSACLADLAVSFGFLHHVPMLEARVRLLRELIGAVRPGGFAVVSLWRFADEPHMRKRAYATTAAGLSELGLEAAALDAGDYLVGWQDVPHAFRYCHSFSDDDVDALVRAVAGRASLVERFRADGRTGKLNEYLVFRRCV